MAMRFMGFLFASFKHIVKHVPANILQTWSFTSSNAGNAISQMLLQDEREVRFDAPQAQYAGMCSQILLDGMNIGCILRLKSQNRFTNLPRWGKVVRNPKQRPGLPRKHPWHAKHSKSDGSCRCGRCFEAAWQKVRKGTGYVNVSELPDDEESAGSKCEPFSFGDVSQT